VGGRRRQRRRAGRRLRQRGSGELARAREHDRLRAGDPAEPVPDHEPADLPAGARAPAPALIGAYIYWPPESASTIGRANLDGSGVDNEFVKTEVSPCDVATNGKYVYWTGGEGVSFVGRAKVSNPVPEDHFIETADDLVCGVAVDSAHIYFNNYASGAIGRANLNGGNVIAEQIMPGEMAASTKRPAVDRKKPERLLKTLKTKVEAGKNKLKLKLTKDGKRALKKKGKLKIKTRFTFKPTGGKPHSETKTIKIKQR